MKIDPEKIGIKVKNPDFRVELKKANIQQNLVTGLIALTPIFLTIYVLIFLLNLVGGSLGDLLAIFPGLGSLPKSVLTLIAVFLVFLLTYAMGVLTRSFVGAKILSYSENLLTRLPIIRKIYIASKQLTNALFSEKAAFRKAVLVQFPRKGFFAIGFITSDVTVEVEGVRYKNVFIPTTPNPTSGFYLMIPENEIQYLTIPPDEAIKIIMSGGIILKHGGLRIEDATVTRKSEKTD